MPLYTSPIPTYNNAPGRSINSAFQPSLLNPVRVSYTTSITLALGALNASAAGQVFLEISQDNVNWVTINSAGISRSLGLSITLSLNETSYYNVQGDVPLGWYCRLRSSLSGGATAAFVSGQEVLL